MKKFFTYFSKTSAQPQPRNPWLEKDRKYELDTKEDFIEFAKSQNKYVDSEIQNYPPEKHDKFTFTCKSFSQQNFTFIKNYDHWNLRYRDSLLQFYPNQDRLFQKEKDGTIIFAIFDGHGTHYKFMDNKYTTEYIDGGTLASIICEKNVDNLFDEIESTSQEDKNVIEDEHYKFIDKLLEKWFEDQHKIMLDNTLKWPSKLGGYTELGIGGTTATVGIIYGGILHVAKVGDSKCILGLKDGSSIELVKDHEYTKQDYFYYDKFIHDDRDSCRIDKNKNPIEYRISDSINSLNMSRSLGDYPLSKCTNKNFNDGKSFLLHQHNPEFAYYKLNDELKFIVACSDGLSDFLDIQHIVGTISKNIDENTDDYGIKQLYKESFDAWMDDSNRVDDISVVVLKVDSSSNESSGGTRRRNSRRKIKRVRKTKRRRSKTSRKK